MFYSLLSDSLMIADLKASCCLSEHIHNIQKHTTLLAAIVTHLLGFSRPCIPLEATDVPSGNSQIITTITFWWKNWKVDFMWLERRFFEAGQQRDSVTQQFLSQIDVSGPSSSA